MLPVAPHTKPHPHKTATACLQKCPAHDPKSGALREKAGPPAPCSQRKQQHNKAAVQKHHACQPPTASLAGPGMQSRRLVTSAAAVHGQLCGTPAVLHNPRKHQRGAPKRNRGRPCCRSTAAYIRLKRRWVCGQRTNYMCKRCSTPHAPALRWLPATADVQLPAKQRTHLQAAAMHTVPPHMHTPQQHHTHRPS